MKRTITVVLMLGLVAAGLAAPAHAGKKPVATKLYLHGNYPVGDGAELAGLLVDGTTMTMDANEPTDPLPKSQSYSFPAGNDQCVGNPLFPSWDGKVAGTIKGDVKLFANLVGAPGQVTARLWIDVPFMSCTSEAAGSNAFSPPVSEVAVDVPPGANEVEIVFKGINKKVMSNMVVELHQLSPASQGRILYDSANFMSRLEFSCVPASGNSCAL